MRPIEYLCTVKSFKMLTPTVFELAFEPNQSITFKAGQFISIVIPGAGPGGRDLRRAYSIASTPETMPIELCVKLVQKGPGTNYLYRLRPGDTFKGFAPYGDFVYETKSDRHACFLATGTGIAPFRSMILSKAFESEHPLSTTCLLGVNNEAELMYMEDFANLSSAIKWVPAVSQPKTGQWKGFKGRVTDYLRALGADFPWLATDFYLCGNGAMIEEVKSILAEKNVQKEAIFQEVYYKPPKATT